MTPPHEDISLGELARRLDRFQADINAQLTQILVTSERRANDYVRKDVYEVNATSVNREIKEIKAGLKTARTILWTLLTTAAAVVLGAAVKAGVR